MDCIQVCFWADVGGPSNQPNGKQEGKRDFSKVWLKITFPATDGEEIETAFSFWIDQFSYLRSLAMNLLFRAFFTNSSLLKQKRDLA